MEGTMEDGSRHEGVQNSNMISNTKHLIKMS